MNAGEFADPSASPREWFFIDTGEQSGQFNMKFDLGLVEEFRITGIPVMRLYGWRPYCITLGRNQDESDIETDLAHLDGIDVVKRPTGGKAVLHGEELTYSVVMKTGGLSVRDSYNRISRALITGLGSLVPDLEFTRSSADFQRLFRDPSAVPCFSASAVYEVEHHGRKLVGSAQHRFGEVLLQHGSILIGNYHKRIVDYLRAERAVKEKTARHLDSHTTTLNEIMGREVGREEVAEAVVNGFTATFGAEFSSAPGWNSISASKKSLDNHCGMETGV